MMKAGYNGDKTLWWWELLCTYSCSNHCRHEGWQVAVSCLTTTRLTTTCAALSILKHTTLALWTRFLSPTLPHSPLPCTFPVQFVQTWQFNNVCTNLPLFKTNHTHFFRPRGYHLLYLIIYCLLLFDNISFILVLLYFLFTRLLRLLMILVMILVIGVKHLHFHLLGSTTLQLHYSFLLILLLLLLLLHLLLLMLHSENINMHFTAFILYKHTTVSIAFSAINLVNANILNIFLTRLAACRCTFCTFWLLLRAQSFCCFAQHIRSDNYVW